MIFLYALKYIIIAICIYLIIIILQKIYKEDKIVENKEKINLKINYQCKITSENEKKMYEPYKKDNLSNRIQEVKNKFSNEDISKEFNLEKIIDENLTKV